MKPVLKLMLAALLFSVVFVSCKKDEDDGPTPLRDRAEEAQSAQAEIEGYLKTHFYNYEDFQNPPKDFDYKIVIDTIAGENSNKIPLIEQVQYKTVTDRQEPAVTYKMYYLNAVQGEGDKPIFADAVMLTYRGLLLNRETFDMSDIPVQLDLTAVVPGFQEGVVEFNGASSYVENEDGSVTFSNFGVGAVFIPSGLAYFNNPPTGVPFYGQLAFTFQLYIVITEIDHDGDGIPSYMEDRNGNGILMDDDTDGDGIPDFLDVDDDGDGVPTRDEIIIHEDGTIEFPDSNNNGIPDYLDPTYPYN